MAVPAHSIPATIAHGTTHITSPDDLPEIYTIIMSGDRMLPKFAGGSAQVFSAAIEPKPGDIVAIWFRRGSSVVYPRVVLRLVSINKSEVVAETLSPHQFKFDAADIVAIHVWLGKPGVFGVMGTALSQAGSHAPAAVINPRDLPKQYALPGKALRPAITSDDKQVFSAVEVPKKGDVVAVWRTPETMLPGDPQVSVYRLLLDLNSSLKIGDRTKARTIEDVEVYVEALDQKGQFRFFGSEIEAIHKWVGPLKEGDTQPQLALPEPAAPVTEQTEPSLLAPTSDGPLTMSSREIAELTGKRHGDVIRDTRVLLDAVLAGWENDDAKLRHQGISIAYDNRGYVSEIHLPKDLTITLVAGYDASLRLKIVRRWMELEGAQPKKEEAPQFPIPQTFAEALMLAANQAAQIEHQKGAIAEKNAQIADMREDVDALDRIAKADDLFGVRVVAKILQMPERKFVETIQRIGWAFRQAGTKHLLGYSDKVRAGYVTSKATLYTKSDGSEGVKDTLKFTALGAVRLAKALKVAVTEQDIRTLLGREKGGAA